MVENILKTLKGIDPLYYNFFEDMNLQLEHYIFKWAFCLFLRDLSIELAIKLLDFYLINI